MKRPKVTIGLPVYNGEKLLPRALDCWVNQDFQDFELIISDNGSTDRTEEICEAYTELDDRVTYYRFERNMGVLRSFARLIDMAAGEYFVMAFHNDFFAADYLSSCLEVLEADSSVVLCYAGAHFIDEEGKSVQDITDQFKLDQPDVVDRYEQILSKLGLCSCYHGLMRTVEAQKTIPLRMNAAIDTTFLSELILWGKFVQIDRPLIYRSLPRTRGRDTPLERWGSFDKGAYPYMPHRDFTTLPFLDMIMDLVDYICDTDFMDETKEALIKHTYRILFERFGGNVAMEIKLLRDAVVKGNIRYHWKDERFNKTVDRAFPYLERVYLMRRLAELKKVDSLIKRGVIDEENH